LNNDTSASPAWAIEIEGLTKSFGSHQALRGIDLKVGRGQQMVIFGPNGAGKTTLIRLLSTLSRPSAGTVTVDGRDTRRDPVQVRRKIGLVSHQTFLYDDLTIHENLEFYGKMYDVPALEQRIQDVVSLVQLEPRMYDRVGTLSRGMQQRVSIARAVIHNPSILLLDEPEVGLDPHAIIMMREILSTLNIENRTVVMTTHNLRQGIELGDTVAILNRGRIVYQGLKQEMDIANLQGIYDHYTGTAG
jgi:heme exporter protein A